MAASPDTRESLILRLPTATDAAAWEEFVELYQPLIYQFARRRSLQDADARELVQNVLVAVAKSVPRWQPNQERGKFRTWLLRIARNQLITMLSRKRPDAGAGNTTNLLQLNQHPSTEPENDQLLLEYRRELFRLAAARVRGEVKAETWKAFWLSAIEQCPAEEVARRLRMTVGAVYIARSRVLARLKNHVEKLESDDAL